MTTIRVQRLATDETLSRGLDENPACETTATSGQRVRIDLLPLLAIETAVSNNPLLILKEQRDKWAHEGA